MVSKEHQYMLQIFMKEKAHLMTRTAKVARSSTRSFERKGDKGFGGGNFKALFESIERAQREPQHG
jgi:4-hydroxyphenylpyruvate dioxygenase